MASHEIIDIQSGSPLDTRLGEFGNALWAINDQLKPIDNAINNHSENVGKWLSTINDTISAGFTSVVEAIAKINTQPPPLPNPLEVKFMFVVKDDNADVNFAVVLGDVTDAEGNPIADAAVTVAVLSTDESVVSVTFDATAKTGSVHFGNPGTATVTATVSSGETLLGSGAADFTVTTGDPAAISSVALNFDGLTETP